MQTRNPILDEFAKLTAGAMGLAQADRFAADMDLVRRDEFDALKAEIAALRTEIAALKGAKKPQKGTSTAASPAQDAAG